MKQDYRLLVKDSLLIFIMALLAGCGLIYEYLLSHYAGRVLGAVESAIYTMIGLMIVAMGLGAFAARKIKDMFAGFAWLEILIALIGACSILLIAAILGFTYTLPQILANTFNIPPDSLPRGGWLASLYNASLYLPYVFGGLLGFFIGMEIPLIARVREHLYGQHLTHNAGTIYGADYIGAGAGAAVWVTILMSSEVSVAAAWTASINIIAGLMFIALFHQHLKWKKLLITLHILMAGVVLLIAKHGEDQMQQFTDMLYLDKAIYQKQTRYQQLVLTERTLGPDLPAIYNFYLNGRLQFSSNDEHIYHEFLVHPALAGSARQQQILIIGGGDGLGLREALKWSPEQVTLIDLDPDLVDLFKNPNDHLPAGVAQQMLDLTDNAFANPSVNVVNDDAFIAVDALLRSKQRFDSIIVDLPDPNHPDLNRLYSVDFYRKLSMLLSGDGLLAVQSTSPFHAKNAFISIKKTIAHSGFAHVEQYQHNVPSFGQWGWTIAAKQGAPASTRLDRNELPATVDYITPQLVQAALVFNKDFYENEAQIKVNHLGSHVLYQYHHQAWRSWIGN